MPSLVACWFGRSLLVIIAHSIIIKNNFDSKYSRGHIFTKKFQASQSSLSLFFSNLQSVDMNSNNLYLQTGLEIKKLKLEIAKLKIELDNVTDNEYLRTSINNQIRAKMKLNTSLSYREILLLESYMSKRSTSKFSISP